MTAMVIFIMFDISLNNEKLLKHQMWRKYSNYYTTMDQIIILMM